MAKKKVGRPTTYKPEYCEEIIEYFSVEPYTIIQGQKVASDFPSFAGFAASIGSHRDSLQEWQKKHAEFSVAYKRAKELQENFIVVNGNAGLISTAFGIFTAKNVIGYRDKQPDEVDQTNINITLADEIAKARKRAKKK